MLRRRVICSIISEFFHKANFQYSQSVFVPETGFSGSLLSAPEILQIIKLPDKDPANLDKEFSLLDQLVGDRFQSSVHRDTNRSDNYAQTEEGNEGLTIDQKLKRIDADYMSSKITERLLPFKELEERMLKYKREVDARMRTDLAAEVSRMKEIEISAVRIEEASKYRVKMQEYRNELEQVHQDKLARLKQREAETIERCKMKEKEIENASFDHRQRVLKDMEILQIKEQEIKKSLEVHIKELQIDKESVARLKINLEAKIKDSEYLKKDCDNRIHEEVERFKLKYDREHESMNQALVNRRREMDEKEYMIQLREDKCKELEANCKKVKDSKAELEKVIEELQGKVVELTKSNKNALDQLSLISTTAKRDQGILATKESENKLLSDELTMLKRFGYY